MATGDHYFLKKFLKPLKPFLDDPKVVEICINRPGEVFIEKLGDEFLTRHEIEELDGATIKILAEQIAATTDQAINESQPLLSASLPDGERFQAILAPATDNGCIISIRKQVISKFSLQDYRKSGFFDDVAVVTETSLSPTMKTLQSLLDVGKSEEFLSYAVQNKVSMIISGGTSSGKTTFLNSLLNEIDHRERLISIEDTRELAPPHKNYCSLIVSKGGQSQANVTAQDLLEASLRLRPDRILLGELRGSEAYPFLRAVNTGHPGSITTVHADTPDGALDNIAMMAIQAGYEIKYDQIIQYTKKVIPIIVQVKRIKGKRKLTHIMFNP